MAGSGTDHAKFDKEVREFFMLSAEKCLGKELPVAEKSVGKSNVVSKMLKETFDDKKMINTVDASIFPKYQDKAKKVTVDQFINNILPDLAQEKVGKGKPIEEELYKMKEKLCKKCDEWKNATKGKSAAVVDRLTDVKGYTGSHKERFDAESGKGKGMEGRVEKHDGSGYVGNYKGSGTFDKTH